MNQEATFLENKFLRETLARLANAAGIYDEIILIAISKENESYADTLVRYVSELREKADSK